MLKTTPRDRTEERVMRAALTKAAKAKAYAEFVPTSYEQARFAGRPVAAGRSRKPLA